MKASSATRRWADGGWASAAVAPATPERACGLEVQLLQPNSTATCMPAPAPQKQPASRDTRLRQKTMNACLRSWRSTWSSPVLHTCMPAPALSTTSRKAQGTCLRKKTSECVPAVLRSTWSRRMVPIRCSGSVSAVCSMFKNKCSEINVHSHGQQHWVSIAAVQQTGDVHTPNQTQPHYTSSGLVTRLPGPRSARPGPQSATWWRLHTRKSGQACAEQHHGKHVHDDTRASSSRLSGACCTHGAPIAACCNDRQPPKQGG